MASRLWCRVPRFQGAQVLRGQREAPLQRPQLQTHREMFSLVGVLVKGPAEDPRSVSQEIAYIILTLKRHTCTHGHTTHTYTCLRTHTTHRHTYNIQPVKFLVYNPL